MPRLGIGVPIVSEVSSAPVLVVQDFFWLNDISGELTPIQTASRTNLVLYSEDFSQWINNGLTLSLNSATAPDGNATADNIVYGGSAGSPNGKQIQVGVVIGGGTANKTFTFSVHVKGTGTFRLKNTHGSIVDNFSSNLTATSDWVRYDFSVSNSSLAGSGAQIVAVVAASTDAAFNLDIWGAQLEKDSRVSAYIATSGSAVTVPTALNDTSNVWDFDGTDIMLEEDPDDEGAWEDGGNLVTNGDFAADSNWTKGAGWTISGGKASNDGSFGNANSFLISSETDASVGDTYEVTFTVSNYVQGSIKARAGQATGTIRTANGTYTETMVAIATETIRLHAIGSFIGSVDNVTVKEYAAKPLNV